MIKIRYTFRTKEYIKKYKFLFNGLKRAEESLIKIQINEYLFFICLKIDFKIDILKSKLFI